MKGTMGFIFDRNVKNKVRGFCCQVPLEPRSRYGVLGRDCKCFVIIGTCENGPVTAEPCRVKTNPLPRVSILFHPHQLTPATQKPCMGELGGGAGYRPRGHNAYSEERLSP